MKNIYLSFMKAYKYNFIKNKKRKEKTLEWDMRMLPLLLLVSENHVYLKWNKRSIDVVISWNLENNRYVITDYYR